MSIFCGIDEAGYGPVLGPLVVTAAAFRHSQAQSPGQFQGVCKSVFAPSPRGAGKRFVVCDSKQLHRGADRFARLERALLPFIWLNGAPPATVHELLARHGYEAEDLLAGLASYPWYGDADLRLPRRTTREKVADRAAALKEALGSAGIEFLDIRARVAHVARYNADVDASGNKATTLFEYAASLLAWLLERWPDDDILLMADRQGGRQYYAPLLETAFPFRRIEPLKETPERSTYRFEDGRRQVTICFAVSADAEDSAVSLASMFSKYVRELFMDMFNAFWRGRKEGLSPTAGYYTDGQRFLREIETLRNELKIDRDLIVRRR